VVDADDGNPALRKLAGDAIADWRARLIANIEDGIGRREIRKSADPGQVANTMISALEGALMTSRIEGSKAAPRDVQEPLEVLFSQIGCRRRG
jgi:TetR/AcrR family transcriptional regulator, transcriptional repressor for nem operon